MFFSVGTSNSNFFAFYFKKTIIWKTTCNLQKHNNTKKLTARVNEGKCVTLYCPKVIPIGKCNRNQYLQRFFLIYFNLFKAHWSFSPPKVPTFSKTLKQPLSLSKISSITHPWRLFRHAHFHWWPRNLVLLWISDMGSQKVWILAILRHPNWGPLSSRRASCLSLQLPVIMLCLWLSLCLLLLALGL